MPLGQGTSRSTAVSLFAVGAIVLLGGLLRVLGIRFGDPFVYHPDEWLIAKAAMTMVRTADWNPHVYSYPSVVINVEAIVVSVMHAAGAAGLSIDQPWLHERELVPAQFGYVLAGRLVVAAMSTATILVVAETTRRLVGVAGAVAAAAILAVNPLAVEHAHYLTTDAPAAFLCALCLLATVVASQRYGSRWWLFAGVLAGLAGSTKWNALSVVGVPVLAYLVVHAERGRPLAVLRSMTPYAILGAAVVGLVVGTPAILVDPAKVVDGAALVAGIYATPDPRQTQDTVNFHVATLVGAFGPALAWCLAGIAVALAVARRDPQARSAIAVAAFIVAYLALVSIPLRQYARTLLPIVPYLAVAGGFAAAAAVNGLRSVGRVRAVASRAAAIGVALVLMASLLPSTSASAAIAASLRRTDTRDIARAWIVAHVPRATSIARETYTPQIEPTEVVLPEQFVRSPFLSGVSLEAYRAAGVRYLVASSWVYDRFVGKPESPLEDDFYRRLFTLREVFRVDPRPGQPGPAIRILRLDPPGG